MRRKNAKDARRERRRWNPSMPAFARSPLLIMCWRARRCGDPGLDCQLALSYYCLSPDFFDVARWLAARADRPFAVEPWLVAQLHRPGHRHVARWCVAHAVVSNRLFFFEIVDRDACLARRAAAAVTHADFALYPDRTDRVRARVRSHRPGARPEVGFAWLAKRFPAVFG
jgi:hypothetical protein